ncbi:MAG TPA: divalent metal cation transporter, partial [Candidatus Acidoferrum sp.]|nr:divalent metal cation transporter [Candidatus Acidoferrum sp.]
MEAEAKTVATTYSPPAAGKEAAEKAQKKGEESWLRKLGPGLITGAADDDPSGIATYSQVGVQFGLSMLWTVLFSFPLMSAIQEICARLGRITGSGIAASMNKRFPKPLVIFL